MTALYSSLGVVAVLLTLPLLAELFRRPVTAKLRSKAPGEFADLPMGLTHYRLSGKETAPLIVCIHGLSTPSFIFAATERTLVQLGYRVLTYDLYGRGYSDRVSGPQDKQFFVNQLRALIQHVGGTDQITLLGFSMGGQIASALAASDDRVCRLVLVASAGLVPVETTGQTKLWRMPFVGDWMTLVFGGVALRRELQEQRSAATVIPDLDKRQADETRMRGFLPALLSSRRHMLTESSEPDHWVIAENGLPVHAIWGGDDPVIPTRAMSRLAELHPDATHVEVAGGDHNLLQTHPSDVAAALKTALTEEVPR